MSRPTARPELSDVQVAAWSGFLAVHSLVTRELDALVGAEQGLALVEYEVLLKLALHGGRLRMSDLADVAFLSRSGLTRIVDELESLELVSREPDVSDGRVWVATLTPLGRRRFVAARATHLSHVRELFFRYLTDAQQNGLAECWEQILTGLEDDLSPTGRGYRAVSRGRRSPGPRRTRRLRRDPVRP